jgi:hypothetical protein
MALPIPPAIRKKLLAAKSDPDLEDEEDAPESEEDESEEEESEEDGMDVEDDDRSAKSGGKANPLKRWATSKLGG